MGAQQSLCATSTASNFQTDASNTIQFDGEKFIVPAKMNFEKQATFIKIETAAKSFCNLNRVNLFYYPLITRMIAYRHEKIFLGAWGKLPEDSREELLEELSLVQHDLMDSFYHHYFQKQRARTAKRSLKTNQVLIPPIASPEDEQAEKYAAVGRDLLAGNKIAAVLMCAGYSSRFEGEDKFLCPINLSERVTILDLLFRRLRRNGACPSLSILVNCNEDNILKIEKHVQAKDYYGFNPANVHFLVNFALPIFDEVGEYCFNRDVKLIKRSAGTANCAEQIFNNSFCEQWQAKGVEYVYFTGADNLLENPCDPVFLGRVASEGKKAGAKCVKAQFFSEPLPRYYSQSSDFIKVLESSNFDQLGNGVLEKLPVAMNSLVFELETLRTVTKDYASNISMAQYYQIIRLEAEIYDFGRDEVREGRCSNFEKDLRYLLTCIKDPLLLSVPRLNEFAPVLSKSRDYSFNEAVNYYRSALERELLEFSKA